MKRLRTLAEFVVFEIKQEFYRTQLRRLLEV